MNPINIQSTDLYPPDYEWLTPEEKEKILSYMNGMQALANRYYQTYMDNIEECEELGTYIKQYNHTVTSLTGSKNAYATLDIMVEYDWPGHRGEWILATYDDAVYARDYTGEEESSTVNQNILLDYTDVGQ